MPFTKFFTNHVGKFCLLVGLLCVAGVTQAQTAGVVAVTANPAIGVSPVTTVLNWTSTPNATGCAISPRL